MGDNGVAVRFPQAPDQGQLIQPQGLNAPVLRPALGVHLISSESSLPPWGPGH